MARLHLPPSRLQALNYEFPAYEVNEIGYKLSRRGEKARVNQLCSFEGRQTNTEIPNLHLSREEYAVKINTDESENSIGLYPPRCALGAWGMTFSFPKIHTASLSLVADSYSLRCDAKQADSHLLDLLARVTNQDYFYLNELLPIPLLKGIQPNYLDQPTTDSVPVVNTLSIQGLSLNTTVCRHITREDFEVLCDQRRINKNDVLLTVDGGVSIGKPCLFNLDDDFTMGQPRRDLTPSENKAAVACLSSRLAVGEGPIP